MAISSSFDFAVFLVRIMFDKEIFHVCRQFLFSFFYPNLFYLVGFLIELEWKQLICLNYNCDDDVDIRK